MLRIDKVY